ncbi:MAG: outer membrane lipid asymmetry maintenance protein MlaD [Deltaproteobacteria bacterium]|jgi:phospholipid/cholesterol/gamma-HCH transport system substrate-binding protein|nr:outer membrane lipid asymmetry maintenance protein MlaD [Deltaproteobacteria bacterium]RPJ07452.1 MAG: outer membrane lipid asymmetry maintenance protein MlaD [Deltaproteobacteria bacterium]
MKKWSVEVAVGLFVLIGIASVGYLTIRLGKMEIIGDNYYTVSARFQSIAGLKAGSEVELAGVPIGQVEGFSLDQERWMAVVRMKILKGIALTDDVIASIKTAGLIGDKYIKLSPGVSDIPLEPGGMITETESALDIEDLISKYVFGKV